MRREKNPSTSALIPSGKIPFGRDWKNFWVTETMFPEGRNDGSKGEVTGVTSAAANRSLIASNGKGAVTCVDHDNWAAPPPETGLAIAHGLQLLPSIFH